MDCSDVITPNMTKRTRRERVCACVCKCDKAYCDSDTKAKTKADRFKLKRRKITSNESLTVKNCKKK